MGRRDSSGFSGPHLAKRQMKRYSPAASGTIFAFRKLRKPPKQDHQAWLRQLLEPIFPFLWKAILGAGGLILLLFFMQIGFMPEIGLADATAMMVAIALSGLVFVVPAGAAIFPAIMLSCEPEIKDSFKIRKIKRWKVFFKNPACFFIWNTFLSLLLFLFLWWLASEPHSSYTEGWTVAIIYALYIAAAFFSSFARIDPGSMHKMIRATHLHIRHFFVKKKSKKDRKRRLLLLVKKYNSQAFAALKAKFMPVFIDAVAWSFCPLFLFALFYSYEGFRQDTWLVIFPLALWFMISYSISYIIIIYEGKQKTGLYSIGAFFSILMLLTMTGSITKIPSAAIRLIGLGAIPNVSVFLKDEGCATFNAIPMPVGQDPLCQGNIVRSVDLKSRIASPYVFEVTGRDNLAWRITIPKEQVISLMIPDQRGGGKRSGEPAQGSR